MSYSSFVTHNVTAIVVKNQSKPGEYNVLKLIAYDAAGQEYEFALYSNSPIPLTLMPGVPLDIKEPEEA